MNSMFRVSIKGIYKTSEGALLLIQDDKGLWDLPGGGMESGESPQQTLIREMFEEMGLVPSLISEEPSLVFNFINPQGSPALNICYPINLERFDVQRSSECINYGFFTPEQRKNMPCYPNLRVIDQLTGDDLFDGESFGD